MEYFERRFTPVMYKALQSQMKAFIADMKENGVQAAAANMDRVMINEQVYDAISKLYKTVGVFYANDTLTYIYSQVPKKGFGFNQDWVNEIVSYFRLHILNKAVLRITETTKKLIQDILIEGERNGWGVDKMAYAIRNSEINIHRARMITRTESLKAMFKGREMGKDKSPYESTSEWIAANDHRTRHSHRLMDGVVVEPNEKFVVPIYKKQGAANIQIGVDLMIGPGDLTANKLNIINCRCTSAEVVKFDAEDNPIMKRQYSTV